MEESSNILKARLDDQNYKKLVKIKNTKLHEFVAEYVELCNPDRVFVCTDAEEDIHYIRKQAIEAGEEQELAIAGHTIHFDGYYDQARDKKHTKFLLPRGMDLGPNINAMDKEEGLEEIRGILRDIMKGHVLYVRFFCLGPLDSEFSIPAVQLTDSSYVAHSEDLLYRKGYEVFRKGGESDRFFRFVHSEGELENAVSVSIEKRRIYIDIEGNIVYSTNTQYGGNTIGLKKLAMRLAIKLASKEGWLTEHMFVMGVHGPNSRVTYFTGAFPSLCGKTSTSMLEGETIIGDDIAYLRKREGKIYAANVERGIFGIIQDVNSKDEPMIYETLESPGEIIFSNVLATEDGSVYWIGKDGDVPNKGFNHSGEWFPGKKDAQGNDIPSSHKNARFTFNIGLLKNMDPGIDDPAGVPLGGIIYGGRNSYTWVPVEESFDWAHGIITKGASLESETTAATLGQEGQRKFNLMSNLDFLSIAIGRYIQNNLDFGANLDEPPLIFSVNYFLRDRETGDFLNEKGDKRVWLKWMELRSHKQADAIRTPTGLIPRYEDLERLFREVLSKDYRREDYIKQFTLRVPEHLAKTDRIIGIYKERVPDTPQVLFQLLEEQRERLERARERYGDYIPPEKL